MQYFNTDLLGSVRLVTDEAGAAVATSTFDEFGSPTTHTGPQPAFGFTGAWTDTATGLVHLRARDYDPATGQFLTVDPLVDKTRQPYAYVGNNPLLLTDPSGLAALSEDEVYDRPYILLNGMLNFGTGGAYGVAQSLCAGNDLWTSLNMAYNPVYSILEGSSNTARAIQNDEGGFQVFMGVLQTAGGIAGLVGITGVGVGITMGLRAGPRSGLSAGTTDDLTTVGRWMGDDELSQMLATGRVVEGRGDGRTFVASPADPAAYPAGIGNYVEFKVPTESLKPAGHDGWKVIPGPNVTTTRWGPPPAVMPPGTCIVVLCVR